MYYDRAEAEAETGSRKAVKNRVNRDISARWRKRGWEDDDKPRVSNRRVDPRDLRLKLQKRHHGLQSGRGVRDLRDKLSGTPRSSNPQKSIREVARPAKKNVAGKTKSETRRTALNKATKKKSQQAADASVDSFLESLGLEKYSTAFQVEEVDMDALMHMTDDDLKAMLMPMGPRKKILLALGSKR